MSAVQESAERTRSLLVPLGAGVLGLVVVAVTLARWAWDLGPVQVFVQDHPGTVTGVPTGTPAWVCALHALNLFFLVLAVRTGLTVRGTRRPAGHWRPRHQQRASGAPVTVEQWLHVAVDLVWLGCGALFAVLMTVSGRWARLIPTSPEVLPGAASMALRYLSLHWPVQDSWTGYNALQMLTYAAVVLVLAPLAALTGLRQSWLWPAGGPLDTLLPLGPARRVHHVVMLAFGVFVVVHVAMVLATGAVSNLDHMFAARDDGSWWGPAVAVAVAVACVGGWFAARPTVARMLAATTGKVTR